MFVERFCQYDCVKIVKMQETLQVCNWDQMKEKCLDQNPLMGAQKDLCYVKYMNKHLTLQIYSHDSVF